jgi:hypothetical protein
LGSRDRLTRSICVALAAIMVLNVGSASFSAGSPPRPTRLAVDASADSVDRRGDVLEARTDFHSLSKLHVRWQSGVTSRIPAWTKDTRVAAFALVSGGQRVDGSLWVFARKQSSRVRRSIVLRPRSGAGPTVRITAGAHPIVDVTHLPADTRRVEIVTVGHGRSLLRFSAPCREHLKREAWRAVVRFRGAAHARVKQNRLGVSCGYGLPPTE